MAMHDYWTWVNDPPFDEANNPAELVELLHAELVKAQAALTAAREAETNLVVELAQTHANYTAMQTADREELQRRYEMVLKWKAYFRSLAATATDFFTDWMSTYEHFEDTALTAAARERRKAAREMMTLIERIVW